MRHRAEKLGGTFKVGENQPRGTVVEWMVPIGGGRALGCART